MRKLPKTDQEFEKLARDCAAWKYRSAFALYGRSGQAQYGADALSVDRKIVVQCKFFDVNKKASYKELRTTILEDFTAALDAFPKMTTFVVATSLAPDTETSNEFYAMQEKAWAAGRKITVDTLYWADIEECLEACETRLVNSAYAADYERTLFLHEGNDAVCLQNLFVPQKYREVLQRDEAGESRDDLFDRIGDFVRDESREPFLLDGNIGYGRASLAGSLYLRKQKKNQSTRQGREEGKKLLILEGDAGCGKTSLVQALCWHEQQQDETALQVLDGRPLVTIRLRDLDKTQITEETGLLPAILDNLGIPRRLRPEERKQYLLRRFPRAVLVMDGFDELCIIEGIQRYDRLLYRLTRDRLQDWRIIVTSRPNYIPRNIELPHTILALQHFDRAKRLAWLRRYTDPRGCAQTVDPALAKYILSGREEGVSDAPLTLYLLAAGNVGPEERENQWRLYHRLFGRELTKRDYDWADHPGEAHRDAAYRLAEEIAHEMYQGGYERLYLDSEELEPLVKRLEEDPALWADMGGEAKAAMQLAERILGLCCYWKSLGDRGAVEFYHNNIRDFFLCEKIYNFLLRIYTDPARNRDAKVEALIAFFRDTFRAAKIENRVIKFIQLRAVSEWVEWTNPADSEPESCLPALEREQRLCPIVFQHLMADRTVYASMDEQFPLLSIGRVLANAAAVWRSIREPTRQVRERHAWWTDVEAVNRAGLLRCLFSEVFELRVMIPNDRKRRSSESLISAGAYGGFSFADFNHANMHSVDLRNADLHSADLSHADLHDANLNHANLSNAFLTHADLSNADLDGANLRGANLTDADLRGTCLPDGFCSENQQKQFNHLLSMKIKGLNL